MCGRTCLTLAPDDILCACKYKKSNIKCESEVENNIKPEWRSEYNFGRLYVPSYNIAPTDVTPVLVSAQHFCDDKLVKGNEDRVVTPMMWGMIPFWHKGDYRKHGLTTNNCRLEHMLESKLYRGPFRRGQRCVVLCEGFYEWQTTKSAKPSERAAYLLYMPQQEGAKIYDRKTWSVENVNLLKMAGLFDMWEDESGDKIYSYSVITFESSKIMSWLHHRMPAILETEQQVNDWLDYKRVTDDVALAALKPATNLEFYRVASLVNNSRNKSDQCNKPIELSQSQKSVPKSKLMAAWLNSRKRREETIADTACGDSDDESFSSDEDDNSSKKRRIREFK